MLRKFFKNISNSDIFEPELFIKPSRLGLQNTPTAYLSRDKTPPPPSKECSRCEIKQSDGEDPLLELWRIWYKCSLPLLPGLLWPGMVAPDMVLSMGQIKQFYI